MNKQYKTILLGVISMLIAIIGFVANNGTITFIALTIFSSLIFFFNIEKISTGLVKLWCIDIAIALFMVIGGDLVSTTTPIVVAALLWASINLLGAYLVRIDIKKSEA